MQHTAAVIYSSGIIGGVVKGRWLFITLTAISSYSCHRVSYETPLFILNLHSPVPLLLCAATTITHVGNENIFYLRSYLDAEFANSEDT